jgi:predicted ArsR family transcriptional regulator
VNVSINRDEWLAAVRAVEPANDPDALTVQELCAILGTKRSATKERVAKLVADGKAVRTSKRVQDVAGRPQVVVAYRLVMRKGK